MKPLLSFLTLLLVGFASSNLYAQYDAYAPFKKEEVRKDKIKWIIKVGYTSCNVDAKNSWELTDSKESRGYDSRGNMTHYSQYNERNKISLREGWAYDDRDNVVEHSNAFEGYTTHTEHK